MRPKRQTAAPRKAAGRPRVIRPAAAPIVEPAAASDGALPAPVDTGITQAEEIGNAPVDNQPEPTAEVDADLIAMSKGDDTQHVHPTTVAAHKAVGWSVA